MWWHVSVLRSLYGRMMVHRMDTAFFVHLLLLRWTPGLSHALAAINNAAMNAWVPIFMWTYIFISLIVF